MAIIIMLEKLLGQNQNINITKHPSIIEIKQHTEGNNFQFHHTTREYLLKILKTLKGTVPGYIIIKKSVILLWLFNMTI